MVYRFRGYFLAISAAVVVLAHRFYNFVVAAFAWLEPPGPSISGEYRIAYSGGTPLPRDLQQKLRHEAGMSRMSAARNR